MSGGHFDYKQFHIRDIAESIESTITNSGQPISDYERKDRENYSPDWYEKYPEDLLNYKYSDEVIVEFKKAAEMLKIAHVYAQRVDWLLSGDDGEKTFLERLKEELNKL